MGRLLALSFLVLLMLASAAGYLFLTQKITAGGRQIDNGIRELEIGHPALEEGRARIKAGRRELSEGQARYELARKNLLLVLADRILKDGEGFKEARKRLAEGLELIARGEDEVRAGEKRIDEGEIELLSGRERLKQAEDMRVAFALGASFFACLAVLLGFRWRRPLSRLFKHSDS